ncbi:hypothetical protein LBBP_03069 [Leptospira borgpetersenii serovar Ballum]|uniref:Uncharacterized protein n=1 Tax=Leptospira borgpetersenii serovar Ballum TaxID=280505 RepID=A0A0S2IUE5_LEPBO|nr:hypothetical protein LBBP_03069 [Leptospira borgpetersenii serovar Ballum]
MIESPVTELSSFFLSSQEEKKSPMISKIVNVFFIYFVLF